MLLAIYRFLGLIATVLTLASISTMASNAATRGDDVARLVKCGVQGDCTLNQFPGSDRNLPGSFLVGVLTHHMPQQRSITIQNAIVVDDVNLTGAAIPIDVKLIHVHFHGPVDLSKTRFGGDLDLSNSVFFEGVSLWRVSVGGRLSARDTKFLSQEEWADFSKMKVGEDARFDGAVFWGPTDFSFVSIGRDLRLRRAWFLTIPDRVLKETPDKEDASFDRIEVAGVVDLGKTTFHRPISVTGARIGVLRFNPLPSESHRPQSQVPHLDLSHTTINDTLSIGSTDLGKFDAKFLQVRGHGELKHLRIGTSANLDFATISILKLCDIVWPASGDVISLDGFNYKQIRYTEKHLSGSGAPGDDDCSLEERGGLERLLGHAKFSAPAYTELAAFLSRQGETLRAMRVQQRGWRRGGNRPLGWLAGALSFGGLMPYWLGALVFSAVSIVRGVVVLSGAGIERGNAILQTIIWFIPGLNLPEAMKGQPELQSRKVRRYMVILRVAGWLLIPIFLATVSGLVK